MHFGGTPDVEVAAEVCIADLLDVLCFEGFECCGHAVAWAVGVPGSGVAVAVGMDEDEGGREVWGVVVVDYVCEIGEGFAAFVEAVGGRVVEGWEGRGKGC